MKYSYYPGCSLHSTSKEYDISTKKTAEILGIELNEIPGWVCCGATSAHSTQHTLSLSLPVKNLISAKNAGSNDVAVCCAACYNRLKVSDWTLKTDKGKRETVNKLLKSEYSGGIGIKHFLEIIVNDYGLDKIRKNVKLPLNGLKTACYYGCLLVRPGRIMQFDDVENPMMMDNLMAASGAEPLDWPHKTECCGANFSLTRTDIVLKLGNDILQSAKDAGADCIVVACPLCQSNLDLRQKEIEKKYGAEFNIPVLFFTQVLALALGIAPGKLGFGRHFVNPSKILKEKVQNYGF